MTQATQTRYVSVADTAKAVRRALKGLFPAIRFRVQSKTYSGGGSISVSWTDGPTDHQVQAITSRFEGASFDSMTDMQSYHNTEHQGQQVHFGANYIFTRRNYTLPLYQAAVDRVAAYWGVQAPPVLTYSDGEPFCDPSDPITRTQIGGGTRSFVQLVNTELSDTPQ